MTRRKTRILLTILVWLAALIMAFPLFWMALTAFKPELAAVSLPPHLIFSPTLENFTAINERSDYLRFFGNSVMESVGATLLCLIIGAPAAYSMAFFPNRRTRGVLMWMLSTKMMPAVGVLVPIYLLGRDMGLIDTVSGMLCVYTLCNLPIVIWMLYSFFREVPAPIIEAGRMDGASALQQLVFLLLPLSLPGILSTSLLSIILCWNEAFWSINLTTTHATPLTAFIASFSSPEGLFWAKLSAASLLATGPILIFGWMTQKHLVRGLTFGAVK